MLPSSLQLPQGFRQIKQRELIPRHAETAESLRPVCDVSLRYCASFARTACRLPWQTHRIVLSALGESACGPGASRDGEGR